MKEFRKLLWMLFRRGLVGLLLVGLGICLCQGATILFGL